MMSPATTDLSPFASSGQLAFLRRLADDDCFRAEVEVDPQAKLAEYGLHIDPADLPAEVRLPPKQAVQDCAVMSKSLLDMTRKWYGFISA